MAGRRATGPRLIAVLLALFAANPTTGLAAVVMTFTAGAIVINALSQPRPHPAPLFAGIRPADVRTSTDPVISTIANAQSTGSGLVSDIQRGLRDLGYYSGDIDGMDGPQTSRAILAFERAFHLTPTGEPSGNVLVAIESVRNKAAANTAAPSESGDDGAPDGAAVSPAVVDPPAAAPHAPAAAPAPGLAGPVPPLPPVRPSRRDSPPQAAAPRAPRPTDPGTSGIGGLIDNLSKPQPHKPGRGAQMDQQPASGLVMRVSAPAGSDSAAHPATRPPAQPLPASAAAPATAAPMADAPPATVAAASPPAVRIDRVQRSLSALGFGPVAVTGSMDDQTAAAIRRFQSLYQLPATGTADAAFLAQLAKVGGLDIH